MARLTDIESEKQALLSVLDSPPDIKYFILSELRDEYFSFGDAAEVWQRIRAVLSMPGSHGLSDLPNAQVLAYDAALSDAARFFISSGQCRVLTHDDANSIIVNLKHHSRLRAIHGGVSVLTEMLSGQATPEDLDVAEMALEDALVTSRGFKERGYNLL